MSSQRHWQTVYETKAVDELSWYRPHLERSLALIRSCHLGPDARIVDVGGGASSLVDDLLDEGYRNLAVIDLSQAALRIAQERLRDRAAGVDWIVGDVTSSLLPEKSVELWHDRAVFHFLVEASARSAYVAQVRRSVKPGGWVLLATFSLKGPDRCSGLPVTRYDAAGIHAALGEGFDAVSAAEEEHRTPRGTVQAFVHSLCRRRAD